MKRFWDKVDRRGSDECWLWQASTKDGRYGSFRENSSRTTVRAHRFAFQLQNGYLPEVVRHSCDTPLCCNPAHLLPGTQADNVRDTVERRRHKAKLSDEQVKEVRRRLAEGYYHRDIAADFNVSREIVTSINLGKTYAHIS